MRKTKIVCTLGLASDTEDIISALIDRGMNVARFNFSHGTHESHGRVFDIVNKLRCEKRVPVATLLDTRGPEIRLGEFENGRASLSAGDVFTLTTEKITGNAAVSHVNFEGLPGDVGAGDRILLDDGLIELRVLETRDHEIKCEVVNGGEISDRKGVNVPGIKLSMPYMSERDKSDIIFGIEKGFDFIAASFVRNAGDVLEIREVLHSRGADDMLIISKIENAEGVENIDEILRVSDGIMVARGDMGVEIDFELLPKIQKDLTKRAYNCGKMVITATQMLESMIRNPRPTRAETTDVANAIYDGTSAIMLSGETAAGLYPLKAVETMSRIAESTENDINYRRRFTDTAYELDSENVTNAISHATCTTAYDLGATCIVTVSMSGRTARNISRFRPDIPIIGCTASEKTYRQLALSWGVVPSLIDMESDLDTLFENAVKSAQDLGYVKGGDLVVISTGVPLGISGTTNLLKVHIAGDVLIRGKGVGTAAACGRLCVADSEDEAKLKFKDREILVIEKTTGGLLPVIRQASAVITEEEGLNSHAAIVCSALDIPAIVGAKNATKLLKNGTVVTVDPELGFVSKAGERHGECDAKLPAPEGDRHSG